MMKARLQMATSGEGRTQDRHDVYFALIAALVSLAAYLAVLPTGYALGDGPELATAASMLGTAHPTGYPVYLQLGHLATAADDAQAGMRLLSLLAVAGSVAFIYLLLRRIISALPLCLAGAFMTAFSPLFIENALAVEVYGLSIFGMTAILWATVRALDDPPEGRWLLILALIYGLVLGHHLTLLALAPIILYSLIRFGKRQQPPFRFYALWIILFGLGLSVYLYLPLRSATAPAVSWYNPQTNERLMHVLSGADYAEFWGVGTEQYIANIGRLLRHLSTQLPFGLILLALVGIVVGIKRRPLPAILLLLTSLIVFFWTAGYAAYDLEVFLQPATLLLLLFAVIGPLCLLHKLISDREKPRHRLLRWSVLLLPAALAVWSLTGFEPSDGLVRPQGDNLLRGAPHRSAVLFGGDLSFPVLEAHHQRDRRPDIVLADEIGNISHPRQHGLVMDRLASGASLYFTDPPRVPPPLPGSRSGVGYLYPAGEGNVWPYFEHTGQGGVLAAETAIRYLISRLESSSPQERKQVWAALAPMAFELAGESSHAHLALGIHWLDDDPELAESFFRRAVELDPWMPSARLDLALALAAQGCEDEAARELEAALAGFGEEEVKNDARRLLNSINTD